MSEKELMPRKKGLVNNSVEWAKVNSATFKEKFAKLSSNTKVVDALYTRAKWVLYNRDGKQTEELYALSLKSGKEIAKNVNQHYIGGIKRTNSFNQKLSLADSMHNKVMLLHNHSNGLSPSINDINALLKNKHVSGKTIGRNGNVFYYTRPRIEISKCDYEVALRKYEEYTEITNIKKVLEELQEK